MKKFHSLRLLSLALFLTCFAANAFADAIEQNGIYYEINADANAVSVVENPSGNKYTGEISIPDNVTISGVTYPVTSVGSVFTACTELTALTLGSNCVTCDGVYNSTSLKSFIWDLPEDKSPTSRIFIRGTNKNTAFFLNCTSIEKIILPAKANVTLGNGSFLNHSSLKEISLPVSVTTIGSSEFEGCTSLEKINLSYVTNIREKAFYNCSKLSSINISNLTSLGDYAFCNTGITTLTIPVIDALKSDSFSSCTGAFANCKNLQEVTFQEGCQQIQENMFSGCTSLTNVKFPTTLIEIGVNAFSGCNMLTSPKFNEGLVSICKDAFSNITELYIPTTLQYLRDGNCLSSKLKLINVAEGNEYFTQKNGILFSKDEKTIYCAVGNPYSGNPFLENENVETIKPYAFYGVGLTGINMPNLKRIGAYAFSGTKLTSFEFSNNFIELWNNALPSTVTSVSCKSPIPPIYSCSNSETAENPYQSNCTLTVPQSSIDLYKNHEFWGNFKSITGNSEWLGVGNKDVLPHGIYYAEKGGNICYYRNGKANDTGIPAGHNPFNLQVYDNAIYVSDAGEQYKYMNDINNDMGDGSLYKVEKTGDEFFKTTLIYPQGHHDDPYACWIDKNNGDVYVANRNWKIYKFNANNMKYYNVTTVPMFIDGWNQLPYYQRGIAYGAMCSALYKDNNGVYWQTFSYNGNGIIKYKAEDIGSTTVPYPIIAEGKQFHAMYIDETNGFLYAYSTDNTLKRIEIANAESTEYSDWQLIDDAPYTTELSTEARRQITGDGKYIYWSYIADSELADASNPLHKSGIKMISATGEPTVTYAVPDIEAYGIAVITPEESAIDNISTNNITNRIFELANGCIEVFYDAQVDIFRIDGSSHASFHAKESDCISTSRLSNGIYIVKATANGLTQTSKIAIK